MGKEGAIKGLLLQSIHCLMLLTSGEFGIHLVVATSGTTAETGKSIVGDVISRHTFRNAFEIMAIK